MLMARNMLIGAHRCAIGTPERSAKPAGRGIFASASTNTHSCLRPLTFGYLHLPTSAHTALRRCLSQISNATMGQTLCCYTCVGACAPLHSPSITPIPHSGGDLLQPAPCLTPFCVVPPAPSSPPTHTDPAPALVQAMPRSTWWSSLAGSSAWPAPASIACVAASGSPSLASCPRVCSSWTCAARQKRLTTVSGSPQRPTPVSTLLTCFLCTGNPPTQQAGAYSICASLVNSAPG